MAKLSVSEEGCKPCQKQVQSLHCYQSQSVCQQIGVTSLPVDRMLPRLEDMPLGIDGVTAGLAKPMFEAGNQEPPWRVGNPMKKLYISSDRSPTRHSFNSRSYQVSCVRFCMVNSLKKFNESALSLQNILFTYSCCAKMGSNTFSSGPCVNGKYLSTLRIMLQIIQTT